MKNILLPLPGTTLSILLILISCGSKKNVKVKELYSENPASAKCVRDGGELLLLPSKEGDYGICLFKDGSVCEEWEYFKGKCSRGDCKKRCMKQGTPAEGWYDCSEVLIQKEKCGTP